MDNIDRSILRLLEINSRTTATAISKSINLSLPAVTERIKQLEESGIIDQYTIKINPKSMGFTLKTFVFVTLDNSKYIKDFRAKVAQLDPVLECHHLAGEYDYLLKVVVRDTDELESFISYHLKAIPGVGKTNTLFSLSTIKETFNRTEANVH